MPLQLLLCPQQVKRLYPQFIRKIACKSLWRLTYLCGFNRIHYAPLRPAPNFGSFNTPLLRLLVHTVVLAIWPLCIHARTHQYIFTRLSVKEGLAANRVYTILQDKKGFIWLGTANGLQRYDGRKLIMFRPPANPGEYLPATGIRQVLEDKQHNFWVRSDSEVGIFDPVTFRYRKAAIQTAAEIPHRSQFHLWCDSKGRVFLIITGHELLVYDSVSHSFRSNHAVMPVPSGLRINCLLEDRATGWYWLATDAGLAIYDPATRQVYTNKFNPLALPVLTAPAFHGPVSTIFLDPRRRLWITTRKPQQNEAHTACYDLAQNRLLAQPGGLHAATGQPQFFQQTDGRLWAYGPKLFATYETEQHSFRYIRNNHMDEYGIQYNEVYCVYEDNEENLWIGTDEGVFIFNPGREMFNTVLTAGNNDKELPVTAFLELPDRRILVSTAGGGIMTYNSNLVRIPNTILLQAPANDRAWYNQYALCYASRSGKVWIGCQEGRIIIHDPVTGQTSFHKIPVLYNRIIKHIVEDRAGNIWLGCEEGELVVWKAATGYGSSFTKGFAVVKDFNTTLNNLYCDHQGQLWVTTHMRGLFQLNPATCEVTAHYDTKKGPGRSLYSNQVNDILQVNDSLLFVTAGALHMLNRYTGAIEIISTEEGLPAASPINLELDNDGNLWMGLLNGICRYNYKRKTFSRFTSRDGLIQENFFAGLKLRNGQLLFGSTHGFVHFHPARVLNNTDPPLDVAITDFKLFNTYLPPDSIMKLDKVRLGPAENSITIEFAALSFLQRDKIVYYYKMDGINDDWVRTDRILAANYTLLPPGEYTFNVMCENADGLESKNITRLVIYIRPPFWRTWWFMALIALSIASLIYTLHRLRVQRLLAMEKVRTRIARDLHDDMGSTLSTINILSTMARMKVRGDVAKTEELLEKISDNSSRMMEAMDDIVWSINPMNDTMQRITARMREFATGVLEAKNIEFTFRVDELVQDLKLDMEARRDLFLIFKEAVNNLAKYSQCRHAAIDIYIQKNKLLLTISDDGIGFDVLHCDGGNGLINMQQRAQSINGKLSIDSKPGAGASIVLEVPVA